jgi:hypothetical protein
MTTHKPGDPIPYEELQKGMRVEVVFRGTVGLPPEAGRAARPRLNLGNGSCIGSHWLSAADRIFLLEAPDMADAETVEVLAQTRWDAVAGESSPWAYINKLDRTLAREDARRQLALLREAGYVIERMSD